MYLATTVGAFEVTLPTDGWARAGSTYEIVFPKPIETSCVALVLDAAYTRGLAHPDVGVAELTAYSEFDAPGATLDDVAKRLSSQRGFAAAQVLERAGAPRARRGRRGVRRARRARPRARDRRGGQPRRRARRPRRCSPGASARADGEAPRKAREKLERCKGAAPALAQRLREDAASRACVAPVLATIAPEAALEPIADAMAATPEEDRVTRAALREAFARALAVDARGPARRRCSRTGSGARPRGSR